MSTSEINAVIDQLTHASVDGASTLSFAGRGLKLDNENDGTSNVIIIIIIIRFHRLSKHSAFIAQLVAVHEFVQSVLEDLQ